MSFDPHDYTTWHGHVKARPDGMRARCGPDSKVWQCSTCKAERAYWLAKEQPEENTSMTAGFDDETLDLFTDEFNPEVEWDDMPPSLDAVALDGDFPGHPFRGNQYVGGVASESNATAQYSRHINAAVESGILTKEQARKAHANAATQHREAQAKHEPGSRTHEYHRKMAEYHEENSPKEEQKQAKRKTHTAPPSISNEELSSKMQHSRDFPPSFSKASGYSGSKSEPKTLVRAKSDDGYKTRAGRLAEAFGGKFSGRQGGYVMSNAAASKMADAWMKGKDPHLKFNERGRQRYVIMDSAFFDAEMEFDELAGAFSPLDEDAPAFPAMDGDFPGHPFRGNQYATAHESSGGAVRASMRAKHHESSGDKAAAKKAHRSAYHAHMAALSEVGTPAAQSYHRTMAKFHRARAGVPGKASKALDAVDGQSLDGLRAAFAEASGAVEKLAVARKIVAARVAAPMQASQPAEQVAPPKEPTPRQLRAAGGMENWLKMQGKSSAPEVAGATPQQDQPQVIPEQEYTATSSPVSDAPEDPLPPDAKLVTRDFVVKKVGRKWLEVTAPGRNFAMQLQKAPATENYKVGDTINGIMVAEVKQQNRYGTTVQYLIPGPKALQKLQKDKNDEAASKRIDDIKKWLGYVEEAANDGRVYLRGFEQLSILGANKMPEYEEKIKSLYEMASAAEKERKRANDEYYAKQRQQEQQAKAVKISKRVLFPLKSMPIRNKPTMLSGKPVVFTEVGKSFRLNENHASLHGSHILGHEGEFGAYAYYRDATPEEGEKLLAKEKRRQEKAQAVQEIKSIASDIARTGERPPSAEPKGEEIFDDMTQYGGGFSIMMDGNWVWAIQGNGADGSDFSQNNMPGAIATRVPRTDYLADRLRDVAARASGAALDSSFCEDEPDPDAISSLDGALEYQQDSIGDDSESAIFLMQSFWGTASLPTKQ